MNTKLTCSTALVIGLLLMRLSPSTALGQTQDEAKPPPGGNRGRLLILTKLDRIRLDEVAYNGLPLAEVVRNLREESRKRDPEKKGINFIINPNVEVRGNVAAATQPPQEQIDIGSVVIKINPPLTDVRLVDVLDAVVKVADHPVRYSVEDYGVVFSLKGAEAGPAQDVSFAFPGGIPYEFLNAVQQQYKVDWLSVADIPKEMEDVRIPKLRINQDALERILPRSNRASYPLEALIILYNQLAEQKPELGKLIVKGDLSKPAVVLFVPDKAAEDTLAKIKVKAFSIYGISAAERDKLVEDIARAKAEARDYANGRLSSVRFLQGTVAIHNDTSLLVATGPESFVEMVESIVTACLAKEHARFPSLVTPPNAPSK